VAQLYSTKKRLYMKKIRVFLVAVMAIVSVAAFAFQEKQHKHGKKEAAKYECPMKCEAPSDKPGKCGKCGMELKKQKEATAQYECPMKCEPAKDKPGKCGKCGMDLKKKA